MVEPISIMEHVSRLDEPVEHSVVKEHARLSHVEDAHQTQRFFPHNCHQFSCVVSDPCSHRNSNHCQRRELQKRQEFSFGGDGDDVSCESQRLVLCLCEPLEHEPSSALQDHPVDSQESSQ